MVYLRYGDKTPRSIPGRCFGILWIIIGIVMMSVLTATLAAAFATGDRPFGTIINKNVSIGENTMNSFKLNHCSSDYR